MDRMEMMDLQDPWVRVVCLALQLAKETLVFLASRERKETRDLLVGMAFRDLKVNLDCPALEDLEKREIKVTGDCLVQLVFRE